VTSTAIEVESLENLGRASRRAALVSLFGFLLVLAAMGYAGWQLRNLEHERDVMLAQNEKLALDQEQLKKDVEDLRLALAKARGGLAASRAAISAFHGGRLDIAVALYDEALAADPDNAYLQNLRAYSLFRLGRIREALDGERLSVAADPNYAWGYFDLARFLCAASPHSLNEAKQAAAKAIALREELRETMKSDGEFQRVCQKQIP
jgi:tetratricopeptide (TPR) repeat protein